MNVGDFAVIVRPKLPVDRVMFLMTYAMDPKHWRDESIELSADVDVLEAVALAFSRRTQRAIHRGLLRGYRREADALNTVRGQIRFADQIGRRYGLSLPIEVAYDEYTEDIEQNRLLKTAIHQLSHAQIRSMAVRQERAADGQQLPLPGQLGNTPLPGLVMVAGFGCDIELVDCRGPSGQCGVFGVAGALVVDVPQQVGPAALLGAVIMVVGSVEIADQYSGESIAQRFVHHRLAPTPPQEVAFAGSSVRWGC